MVSETADKLSSAEAKEAGAAIDWLIKPKIERKNGETHQDKGRESGAQFQVVHRQQKVQLQMNGQQKRKS